MSGFQPIGPGFSTNRKSTFPGVQQSHTSGPSVSATSGDDAYQASVNGLGLRFPTPQFSSGRPNDAATADRISQFLASPEGKVFEAAFKDLTA